MSNVVIPEVGESVSSGIIATWLVKNGDMVEEGQDLFELETDKATLPIPSPGPGVITIQVEEGEEITIGAVVASIAEGSTGATKAAAPSASEQTTSDSADVIDVALSPAVRVLLEQHGLDPKGIPSKKPGRLTKEDVEAFLKMTVPPKQGAKPAKQAIEIPTTATKPIGPGNSKISAAQERVPMTTLRKKIAENLVASKQQSAHLTTFNEVDMSTTMAIRSQYKDIFEKKHGARLGFMSFFIKAAVYALTQYPKVNAYIDGTDIIYNHFYNIGVAISTEAGLLVPVIRDADQKNFAEIEASIVDFGTRAKKKRIMPDEFVGGTFTISNGGVFGSMLSTPIPSPPQTAILGMHTIQKRAVVINDEIVIRPMMYLALSYDHRILDGKDAIAFLMTIKTSIENPERILLDL